MCEIPLNKNDELLGWCVECKDSILPGDDHMIDYGKLYCSYCYKVIHNIHEELNFE